MDKNLLSGAEICKIIDACARRGVFELKFGPLELKMNAPAARTTSTPAPDPKISEEIHKEALEVEEIHTREDQIAELLITDPYQAEKMMMEGELVPDGEADGTDSLDN